APADTVALWVPTVLPSFHDAEATPLAPVVTLEGVNEPPPVAPNETATPATGSPSGAVTITETGFGSVWLTFAVCPLPLTAAIALAPGRAVSVAASDGPVSSCAVTDVEPRALRAEPAPVALLIVPSVPSPMEKTIGVFGTTALLASSACAENANPPP